jgi:hypothetical protein
MAIDVDMRATVDRTGPTLCQCPTGTGGDDCSSTSCTRSCQNGGSCRLPDPDESSTAPFCDCRGTGHIGDDCEIPFVACQNVICLYGGKCATDSSSSTRPCQCPSNRKGEFCQFDVNDNITVQDEEEYDEGEICPVHQNIHLCTQELLDSVPSLPSNCDCYAFCGNTFVKCQSYLGGFLSSDECPNDETPITGCHIGIATASSSSGGATSSPSSPFFSTGAIVGIVIAIVFALSVFIASKVIGKRRMAQQRDIQAAKAAAATSDLELTDADLDTNNSLSAEEGVSSSSSSKPVSPRGQMA